MATHATACRQCRAHSRPPTAGGPRAFSLIELVIVTVIIGIVAAIAAPRFSRAGKSATASYVVGSISTVRQAIELYYAEHGQYPGYTPGTTTPNDTWFTRQLLEYSDATGNTQASYGHPFIYGPYLRPPFPTNPFNNLDTVKVKQNPGDAVAIGGTGWIAVLSTGDFGINTTAAHIEEIAEGSVAEGMVEVKGL
ncbi:MAG TPA: prepilin-type N-terminal cleavage/methylation domain-containing protein [Phycisphaerae bacterium]|nr:prepilin-type N-terminal cleavage/methylation domain-containing protein [Phycisphaerae bacterium]